MQRLKDLVKAHFPEGRLKTAAVGLHRLAKAARGGFDTNRVTVDYDPGRDVRRLMYNSRDHGRIAIDFPSASGDSFIWEGQALEGYFLNGEPQEGDIVIDAGAYLGEFSVAAARMVGPRGRVIALEPNSEQRSRLKETLQLNGVEDRVVVERYALSNEEGYAEFMHDGAGSRIIKGAERELTETEVVPTVTLDRLLDGFNVFADPNKTIWVKMDIEGAEIEAIKGAPRTLEHGARFMIAAYHPRDGTITATLMPSMFEAASYKTSEGNPRHLTLYAEPQRSA